MWLMYAFASAFFAGITAVLSKIGIQNINSHLATAIRTIVVLIFSWLIVLLSGSIRGIGEIETKTLIFLILSGIATGGSWLCYFRALQLGNVNKVTPIDKSSTILTMILAFIFFHEQISALKILCIALIGIGTYMMIENKGGGKEASVKSSWLLWAVLSAVFAALTAILGKVGITGIDSNLGTATRTIVVLLMSWLVVFVTKSGGELHNVNRRSLFFLITSGLATGLSWLAYYKALQSGPASVVVPIDKLSIWVTIFFSCVVLKEKMTKKSWLGLSLLTAGTLLLLV